MQKEIHFYEYFPVGGVLLSWADTEKAIFAGAPKIYTVQMGCLCFACKLFEDGYRIFIHEEDDEAYEIKLGDDNERTNRHLRIGHNYFKMWLAGEFIKKGDLKNSENTLSEPTISTEKVREALENARALRPRRTAGGIR